MQIVEETLPAEVSLTPCRRATTVNANQLFDWRKLYQTGLLGHSVGAAERDESRLLLNPAAVWGMRRWYMDCEVESSSCGVMACG